MFRIVFIIVLCLLFVPSIMVSALSFIPDTCGGSIAKCGLDELLAVFVNIAQWILGVIGSVALLMIVYGGFLFILGAKTGDKENKINTGKAVLQNAIVGLIIVLCSYVALKFIVEVFDVKVNLKSTNAPGKPTIEKK